jgi:hypothetical protein
MTKKIKKSLIELFQEVYPRIRPTVATILVLAFSVSTMIDNIPLRVSITSALGVTLLFLLFDMSKSINQRLDKIDSSLRVKFPPDLANYNVVVNHIREILEDRLGHNKDVTIRILCVSAQFTWKQLIEETLPEFFNMGNRNPKITVELLIVKPELLRDWGQLGLSMDAEATLLKIPFFENRYKAEFDTGKISLTVLQYDTIPQWHGLMVDDDIIFIGECKWEKKDDQLHLLVGQKEYRKFSLDDNFQGVKKIQMFRQWFEAFKVRSKLPNKRANVNAFKKVKLIKHQLPYR